MYSLPMENGSVDAVTFHQVLHYADDPAAAIAEAGRVLKAGGRLVVVDFLPHELEYLHTDHAHRRLGFADSEVKTWFKASGLASESSAHLKGDPLTVGIWPAVKNGLGGGNGAGNGRLSV
jgi:ArsR family transcriptional regulator